VSFEDSFEDELRQEFGDLGPATVGANAGNGGADGGDAARRRRRRRSRSGPRD
jgi:hypothetical protein